MNRLLLAIIVFLLNLPHANATMDGGLFNSEIAPSQDFALFARQEPPVAEFGKPFDFVIEVQHTSRYQIQFPETFPQQDNLRALGRFSHTENTTGLDAGVGLIKETWRITLIPLDIEKIDTPVIEAATNLEEPLIIDPMAIVLKTVPPPKKDDEKKDGFESNAGPFVFFVPDDRIYVLGSSAAIALILLLISSM